MSNELKLEYGFNDDIAVIRFNGELDMNTIGKAYDTISDIIDSGYIKMVFNLEELEFIDSTGLGFFTGSLKKLKEKNGDLKICSPSSYLKRIFSLIHMDYFIDIFDDEDKALEKFKLTKDDTIKKWEEVIRVNPTYADAHFQLALAHKNEGNFSDSMKEVTTALDINSNYSKAYKLRGDVFRLTDKFDKACENYKKAFEINTDYIEPKVELATLTKDPQIMAECENILVNTLKEKGNYADLNNLLGRIYFAQDKLEKALEYFEKALSINNNFTDALINKAQVLLALKDSKSKSVAILKKAFKVSKQKYLKDIAKNLIDELEK
ncbi:MAG: anti-sigma factor antagonist [Candidatus Muirbacterium halophilum]|nr:anti-sigma factor antagonist [Candidatus Muirbacterium halophilum]MCK9474463.1 anti-sigma factor antagonist [Candidatus Muirbacterium halophilum]